LQNAVLNVAAKYNHHSIACQAFSVAIQTSYIKSPQVVIR